MARRAGVALAFPDAAGLFWNDGSLSRALPPALAPAGDDLAFLDALIDALVADGTADPAAVHIAGVLERRHDGAALRLRARRPPRLRGRVPGDHAARSGAGLPPGAAAAGPPGGRHRRPGGALDGRGDVAGRRRNVATAHVGA
jgi:hypothetical protein